MGNSSFTPRYYSVPHGKNLSPEGAPLGKEIPPLFQEKNSKTNFIQQNSIQPAQMMKAQFLGGNFYRCPWCYIVNWHNPNKQGNLESSQSCSICGEPYYIKV